MIKIKNGPGYSIVRTINYLRRQKSNRKIHGWEIETSDRTRGLFGVRVSAFGDFSLFNRPVSGYYYGRDLLSAAHRAVAEVTK